MAELNFAEICHILCSTEPDKTWGDFAQENIQRGGYQCSFVYKNSAIIEKVLKKLGLNEPLKNKNFTTVEVRPFDSKDNVAKLLNPEGYAVIRAIIEQASYNLFNPNHIVKTVRRHWRILVDGLEWAAPKGNSIYGSVVFTDEAIKAFGHALSEDLINGAGTFKGIRDYIKKFNELKPEDRGDIVINSVEDTWDMIDGVQSLAKILADRLGRAMARQIKAHIDGLLLTYKRVVKGRTYNEQVNITHTASLESNGKTLRFKAKDIDEIVNRMSQRQFLDTTDNNVNVDWNIRRKYYIKDIKYDTNVA